MTTHDEHEPMPGGRVRAFDVAFHQCAVFVLFADDSGHGGDLGLMESAGLFVWRSPESPGMQKANPGGLAKRKKCKQISWLPDLGSNQGPTD